MSAMRRFIHISILVAATLLAATESVAQSIALDERTPRIRRAEWLNNHTPRVAEYTFIDFINSASAPCLNSVRQAQSIISGYNNISTILITREHSDALQPWVATLLSPQLGVIVADERIRKDFGVNYAPFAILLDHKRRAIWFGNPNNLDRTTIEKLITK